MTKSSFEYESLQSLKKHLTDCIELIDSYTETDKALQVHLQRVDARLLVCRKLIALHGIGFSTVEPASSEPD